MCISGDHASPNFVAAVATKKMGESMTYVIIRGNKLMVRRMTELDRMKHEHLDMIQDQKTLQTK